ncbi:MAG TPA: hypothetical protein VEC08_03835 [Nitrososphaerales archaeon]|nr:hypothetical protein [Nitrososphaerales archaeon]
MRKTLVIAGVVTSFIGIALLGVGLSGMHITEESAMAIESAIATHAIGALIIAIGFFIIGAGVASSPRGKRE